jgi:hypothetical protein
VIPVDVKDFAVNIFMHFTETNFIPKVMNGGFVLGNY